MLSQRFDNVIWLVGHPQCEFDQYELEDGL